MRLVHVKQGRAERSFQGGASSAVSSNMPACPPWLGGRALVEPAMSHAGQASDRADGQLEQTAQTSDSADGQLEQTAQTPDSADRQLEQAACLMPGSPPDIDDACVTVGPLRGDPPGRAPTRTARSTRSTNLRGLAA